MSHVPRVLYICHNHASIKPGGVETYSLELFDAMRDSGAFDPVFLARATRPDAPAAITAVPAHAGHYFFHVDHAGYDGFFGAVHDKGVLTRDFDAFLRQHRPDVVHFQHTLFLGYDLIRQVRNTLPHAAIVYTLHEFLPICHHNGQMVRTQDLTPCPAASPDRCHECFPDISPEAFQLRKLFITSQLALVDLFIAPSRFLRSRYLDWGLPADRVRYEDYGRHAPEVTAAAGDESRERNRFGFFGQFTTFKGVDLLLRAMAGVDAPAELYLHGANLEFQSRTFQREFRTLVERAGPRVTLVGSYSREAVPELMAHVDWVVVPSLWWENSPLVIQEAFQHGRPVICSDIGGMAEKVTAGINGLHFRAGDVESLADTLATAATTPGLWERLRAGIPQVPPMRAHVAMLVDAYQALLAAKRA